MLPEAAQSNDSSEGVGGTELFYNLALTHFELQEYPQSVEHLDRILSKAYETYPQLTLPFSEQTTSEILRKTSLIEALNLKAAIQFLQN